MTLKSSIIEVLRKAGTPLHIRDIIKMILDSGLWQTDGKTPEDTASSLLSTDIKNNGVNSLFVKIGPNIFALKDSIETSDINRTEPTTFQEQSLDTLTLSNHPEIHNDEPEPTTIQDAQINSVTDDGFSFIECAQKVLEEFGGKKPMHYKEITERAIEKGWLVTAGKTPDATMYA
jgi:restriction system protein